MKQYTFTKNLIIKARWFELAGDATRIRILCSLFDKGELCVSEIASHVQTSVANASHHLRIMRASGMLLTSRRGNHVYYMVVDGDFTEHLKEMVCTDVKILVT